MYQLVHNYLWNCTVKKNVHVRNCRAVYIVIDNPEFLPPPRTWFTRCAQNGQALMLELSLEYPTRPIYHLVGLTHHCLIQYLTTKYVERGTHLTSTYHLQIVIGSPTLHSPVSVADGHTHSHPPNQHGEADYAIWHHTSHTSSSLIGIISSDTDTWVYGLALVEIGWVQGKSICKEG